MMYLFNSTERCYIKRTTDNVLQIHSAREIFRMSTGIFRKYPSQHRLGKFRLSTGIFRKYPSQT
jgi:hypothetical protein